MNITSRPFGPATWSRDQSRPSVPGSVKSGASAPRWSGVAVAAMRISGRLARHGRRAMA
jgi:hypothetical protein